MIIQYKKLNLFARKPEKNNTTDIGSGSVGYDLFSAESVFIPAGETRLIKTGIALSIPSGYGLFLWPRSGNSNKYWSDVLAGVIDPSYRGEIGVLLSADKDWQVNVGDKVVQGVIQRYEDAEFIEVHELDVTVRGSNGFGSSGF